MQKKEHFCTKIEKNHSSSTSAYKAESNKQLSFLKRLPFPCSIGKYNELYLIHLKVKYDFFLLLFSFLDFYMF